MQDNIIDFGLNNLIASLHFFKFSYRLSSAFFCQSQQLAFPSALGQDPYP